MPVADEFFALRDLNKRWGINSAAELWDLIIGFKASWLTSDPWPIELEPGSNLFFRGQPNTEYGLSSKLYRDIRSAMRLSGKHAREVDEALLRLVETQIIAAMRGEGIGRRMSDGELLMVLQHHGIATRLVDVSDAPVEALFFAVDQQPDKDGRLFIIHPHADSSSFKGQVSLGATGKLPWSSKSWGTRSAGDWTTTVAAVNDTAVDPRMRAQQGHFLVGGLNRRYGGKRMIIGTRDLSADEFVEVSTLNINFLRSRPSRANSGWGATGWCIRILAGWKSELLQRLASLEDPITPDSMYPPLNEVSRLARTTLRNAVATSSS